MKKKWLQPVVLSLLCAMVTSSSGAIQDPSQDRYQFRVTVDLISLNVTVVDTRNRFINVVGALALFAAAYSLFLENSVDRYVEVYVDTRYNSEGAAIRVAPASAHRKQLQ